MAKITIEVPDRLLTCFGKTEEERSRVALEALAVECYRRNLLPGRRTAELLGIPYVDLIPFMAERDVAPDDNFEDFAEGVKASREFSTRRK